MVEEKRAVIETSSRSSSTTGRADRARASSASSTRAASGSCRRTASCRRRRSPASSSARLAGVRRLPAHGSPSGSPASTRASGSSTAAANVVPFARTPYFCSGCPHNTSTRVPEGSRALAGIGCHYMAQLAWTATPRPSPRWAARARRGSARRRSPTTTHIFANLGDGTYYHSGILAIRAAVAAGVNITYKILYNDAVAMTGGQPVDGALDRADDRARSSRPRACSRIVVVTDEPDKYPLGTEFAARRRRVRHRDELDEVQRELREVAGVTVLIYDQTCAAEKRRRRKRGRIPDPPQARRSSTSWSARAAATAATSNCLSVVPVETEFGRKRAIDQSTCNKDYSCLKGFCPSFVTVEGGSLKQAQRRPVAAGDDLPPLPEPALPGLDRALRHPGHRRRRHRRRHHRRAARHGGASRRQGRRRARPDRPGAEGRRGDEPRPHRRQARTQIHAVRIAAGGARLLLGCDLVVPPAPRRCRSCAPGTTRAVVNSHETITGDFTRNPDLRVPEPRPAAPTSPTRSGRAAPSSSTRPGSRPGCSATRSRPTCSCSATPSRRAWCRSRPRRSSARSS